MKLKSLLIVIGLSLLSANAWSYGTGISNYPILLQQRFISAEFTGITSEGGGVGVQGRFTQKFNTNMIFDAGLGMGGGDRSSRIFAGLDFELYPDYMKQPRVSIKGTLQNAKEGVSRKNTIGFAPTVSKGFSFWGHEAYPFVSIPYSVSLDTNTNTYETTANLNLGITGALPFEDMRHLTATFESTIGIKDSYTAVFMGVAYPFN